MRNEYYSRFHTGFGAYDSQVKNHLDQMPLVNLKHSYLLENVSMYQNGKSKVWPTGMVVGNLIFLFYIQESFDG